MEQEQEKLPQIVHSSWTEYLQPLFNDVKMLKIKYQILTTCAFYPSPKDIFRVFSMPIQDIKVVILGQDPYPRGEGVGLAFAVKEDIPMPGSLRVIAKEIEREGLKSGFFDSDIPQWRNLEHWTEQGVFLLNTALTVEAFKASTHLGYWQWFTREVIKIISRVAKPTWLLWGAKAQSFADFIEGGELVTKDTDIELNTGSMTNMILKAPHPAAELYMQTERKSGSTFTGCNHFKLCNMILEGKRQKQINW